MTDNYQILFQLEAKCEKELKKNRIKIEEDVEKIIKWSVIFYESGIEPHIQKLVPEIQERLHFETTLYIIKLGRAKRALVTIDVDEIFDQLIITMWAYTTTHDYQKIFRSLGESMYQKYLNQEVGE